jgi:hypothetical protein
MDSVGPGLPEAMSRHVGCIRGRAHT